MFQTPEIFADLTLLQNVMIPAFARRDGAFAVNALVARRRRRPRSATRPSTCSRTSASRASGTSIAGSLSRGDKRRLELAMCLVQNPRLLLLDEPTAGMSRADTNTTIELLQRIGNGAA